MFRHALWVAAALAPATVLPGAVSAQQGADWNQMPAKAKTQKLVLVDQGSKSFDTMIEEFTKTFGITVEAAAARVVKIYKNAVGK